MDHSEKRLLLYDRTSHHLYRLSTLLLDNKTQAQSVLLQVFSNLLVRGRRATHTDWEGELREQVVRLCLAQLPPLSFAPIPARRSVQAMPAGARVLSILVHYGHIAPETVATWLNLSPIYALNALYGIEEMTGMSAGDLHASWRAEAALTLPPPQLRAKVSQLRPAPQRMPAWVAASVAIIALMVGLINGNSQAAMPRQLPSVQRHPVVTHSPKPTPTAQAAPDADSSAYLTTKK